MDFINDYKKNIFAGSECSIHGRVRKANEDYCDYALKTSNGDIFVVCDGMGGHVGGKQASTTAVNAIIKHLKDNEYNKAPRKALHKALEYANTQILGYAIEHPEYKGMGTTACVLMLQDDQAWIAHAGDSRIYLFLGKEKKLHRITKDHSYVQRVLVDQEGYSEEAAERHPRKNIILKALGTQATLSPEVAPDAVLPQKDDIFVICSDGLTGEVPDILIEQILSNTTASLQEKGKELIRRANGEEGEGKGKDNITVQLIQIEQSPHKKSVFTSYNPKYRETENRGSRKNRKNDKNSGSEGSGGNGGRKTVKILMWIFAAIMMMGIVVVGTNYVGFNSSKKYDSEAIELKIKNDSVPTSENIKELEKKIESLKENIKEIEVPKGKNSYADELKESKEKITEIETEIEKIKNELKDKLKTYEIELTNIKNRKFEFNINNFKKLINNESNYNRKESRK